jgi:perosamine synthetase
MKVIPYSRQSIDQSDIQAVINVLKSDFLTCGPKIEEFENKLCKYTGAKFCVVLNSGTAALHAAYFALGLKPIDEIITSPITFAATSNAALYLGGKVKFADIDKKTGNIDLDKVEGLINQRTKILVPIHYAGYPIDMVKIKKLAKKYKLKVVEDACHALGAECKGNKVGNCKYGDASILSFHPVKHITTGEGGAVLTNNKDIYEKVKVFRTHGIVKDKEKLKSKNEGQWYHEMQELGFNYRMTDIQAGLGISQLSKLDKFIKARRKVAQIYKKEFKDNPYFDLQIEESEFKHAYHLFPIRLKDKYRENKKEIFRKLREAGLWVQVHYIPVYLHPYYQKLGYKKGLCPIAEDFYKRVISIPIYVGMKDEEVKRVVRIIYQILSKI